MIHVTVESLSHVWLFCDPMDYSPLGSSIHGFSQATILEWIPFSSESSWPGLNPSPLHWQLGIAEPPGKPYNTWAAVVCAWLFETPAFKRRVPRPHVALSIGWNLNKPWPDDKVLEDKSITRWQDRRIWIPELPCGTELLPARCVLVTQSCPTPFQLHGLQRSRLLCPWYFPGKNTGMGCHFLL